MASWCSTPTSGSSAGTGRSRASTASRADDAIGRQLADVFDATVRRGAARRAPGESVRRDALPRAAHRPRRRRGTTIGRRSCWSTRPPCRCRASRRRTPSAGTILLLEDITDRVQPRGAAADLGEDGVDRPAGRRRRARGEHAAHRHLELHADAARRRRPGRSEDGAPREDREADVPRREDRQRPAESLASRRTAATSARRWTSTR